MEHIKVSIIVPVYNVEKYIERTLVSLVNQTLKEIEIIVINDGSTDNSDSIIKKIAGTDERIRYISRENRGVGPTRNEGVSLARGEYIGFCDSDDTVDEKMYEKMYKTAIKTESDIVVCDKNIIKDGKIINIESNNGVAETANVNNVEEFFKSYYYTKKYENHVWDKIFRKELVLDKNIQFGDLKEITGEDTFFAITIIPYCNKITFINDKLYNYEVRQNSIMNTYNPEKMKKTIKFIEKVDQFEKERNLIGKFSFFLAGYLYNLAVASSREAIKNKNLNGMKQDIKMMIDSKIVNEYATILQEKEVFKDKKKQYFCKLLGNFINKKRNVSLYILLRIKYYI